MKIGILTNEYPPNVYGGAGVHVEYLTAELAKADKGEHSVKVFCFGDQKKESKNLYVKGINPVFKFSAADPRHDKFLDTMLKDIVMSGEVNGVDILHCHTWYSHFAGLVAKQLLGVPLILTTHSLEPHRPWKAEQLGTAYNASSWIEKTAYENADGVIAVSEAMKKDVHSLYGVPMDKIAVIHNGIDVNEYRQTLDLSVLERYGISRDVPYILFVGRITRQKGIIHLVNAIKHVNSNVQVVLCAGSPDTKEIAAEMELEIEKARKVSKNSIVWIREMVPRPELIALYSQASVFVCPSVYEPFGIINIEAMACGTPVVASAVGGIPEIVVPGKTGSLVPIVTKKGGAEPAEPEKFAKDLASAVDSLLASKEKLKKMGEKSRERVVDHFSWTSIAARTLEFYSETIKKTNGSSHERAKR
jgi:glycogen synthase